MSLRGVNWHLIIQGNPSLLFGRNHFLTPTQTLPALIITFWIIKYTRFAHFVPRKIVVVRRTIKGLCTCFSIKMRPSRLCAITSNFIKIALVTQCPMHNIVDIRDDDASPYNFSEFVPVLERKRDAAASRYSSSVARSIAPRRTAV